MNWYMDKDRWLLLLSVLLIAGSFVAMAWVTFF